LPEILILQSDSRAHALLKGALDSRYRCRRIHRLKEASTLLPAGGPRAVVLDFFDPSLDIPLTALRNLRREQPSLALVVAGDFSGREMDLYHLGRASVDGVVRLEANPSARDILSVVNAAMATRLAEVVVKTVGQDLPPLAQEAVRWAIEKAEERPQVSDLAAALALTPRSLSRELRVRNLAPARTLLLWGRLLQASHFLERNRETVENVAFRLGYATGGTLRKALRHHVGASPTEIVRRGGLRWALTVFRRRGLRRGGESKNRWNNTRSSKWRAQVTTRKFP
jgi:AraC-like DNA-binding protein